MHHFPSHLIFAYRTLQVISIVENDAFSRHRVNIRFNNDRILIYLKIVFAERTHCIKVIKTISK